MSKTIQISNVIAQLDRDHANIAILLDFLESEILAIDVGKTPDYPLLRDIIRYMVEQKEEFHHPREDLIFTRLVERNPEYRVEIQAIGKEHASIIASGRLFQRLLSEAHVDTVDSRQQLASAGRAYVRELRNHLRKEEERLFPLAMTLLTEEDWHRIELESNAIADPVFDARNDGGYQRLHKRINDHGGDNGS